MLGRKSYTRDEVDRARAAIDERVAAYDALRRAVASGGGAAEAEALESAYFTALVLALDRFFVHRVRTVTGKDTNPLSEVELVSDSLIAGTALETGTVVTYVPEKSVLGLAPGDPIVVTADGFRRLSAAFLATIETRFLDEGQPT